jgi:hypothetical protein
MAGQAKRRPTSHGSYGKPTKLWSPIADADACSRSYGHLHNIAPVQLIRLKVDDDLAGPFPEDWAGPYNPVSLDLDTTPKPQTRVSPQLSGGFWSIIYQLEIAIWQRCWRAPGERTARTIGVHAANLLPIDPNSFR